jgi:hypothetical protein
MGSAADSYPLPNCLDSSGLKATVAGDKRKADVKSSCCNDEVGHFGNAGKTDLSPLATPDHRAAQTMLLMIR